MNILSPLWSFLIYLRNYLYNKKFFKVNQVSIPVISVGNITMGGTGKTPFIHWLLEELFQNQFKPSVICRSYKGSLKDSEWVTTEPFSFHRYGDESVLLKLKNPRVPIMSGPQKWVSAERIAQLNLPSVDVILVDDGFQHRQLFRDLDIVLLDSSVSIKDYYWPPFGRARESFRSLVRAQVIVWTKWEQKNDATVALIKDKIPKNCLILTASQIVGELEWVSGRKKTSKISKVMAFCGLGRPQSFLKSLKTILPLDTEIDFISFSDHAEYSPGQIKELASKGETYDIVVTSEKDRVKLQEWPFQGPTLCVIPMRLKVEGPLEEFREKIITKIRKRN